jgi:hypothetical protein
MGWALAVLLVGAAYLVIGRVFALPAIDGRAARLAAWAVSGVLFVAHLGYEHVRLRSPSRTAAVHAALAAAIGAFGLAVAGMLHTRSTGAAIGPLWLLALVLWPLITAVPAFLVALLLGLLLRRLPRGADAG